MPHYAIQDDITTKKMFCHNVVNINNVCKHLMQHKYIRSYLSKINRHIIETMFAG